MQAVNTMGQVIESRILNDHDRWIGTLKWPEDFNSLRKLSFLDFKSWLYGMDPRDAMILSSDPEFRKFFDGYLSSNKWKFIWRLIWG